MIAGLTVKQDKFVREYAKTGNGTQSAIKAGYSRKSSKVIASQTLTNVNVADAVMKLRQRTAERLDISRDKLLNDVAHIAEQAQVDGEFAAAINANTLLLKVQGHMVERSMNMSVDVTQSHLDALQKYTDARIDQALANYKGMQGETSAAVVVDADVSNAHCTPSEDRSMGVMTNDTHADERKA